MAANLAANTIENLRLLARDRERENQLKQSQKMEALGRLAGGVAHDFNNIMTAVYGYSDLAISELGNDHPKAAYFIQEAKKCGERAEPFIKQLLGFSRSQVLQPRSLNLNQAIEDFKSVINVQTGENITVHYLLDDRVPPVYLDPVQVQQILLNLAVNARDAMPNGGEITIETRVARSPRSSQLPVILTFSDTGIGMDADTQRHIFEPFFTTKEDTGTGLGLSLVYGTVDQASGAISVMSQPNQGTTFTIKFPAATSAEAASHVPDRLPKVVGARGHYKLLVAEDDLSVQTTIAYALRQAGYEVFVVNDGQQALDMIERDPDSINLVITDFLMPTMNGHQLATRIKEFKPNIKVIFISGYAKDITSQQAELPPGTHFIQKPFSHAVLLHTVDRLLDDKTRLAAEL
jgi:nitrogen-specific signal transduction histidine kinase/ActR/RegA family two-component response regulator